MKRMTQQEVYYLLTKIFVWLAIQGAKGTCLPELAYNCEGVSVRPVRRIK